MLLEWISQQNLLSDDPNSNVLDLLPGAVKRTIVSEVTNVLHQSTASEEASSTFYTSSTATPASQQQQQLYSRLTSDLHVRWITEVVGQAFGLPLEDIAVTANAAAIYTNWLLSPSKRPAYIQSASLEARQDFFQSLLRHLSVLFQPKALDVAVSSKSTVAALATKHVELCKTVLRALTQAAVNAKANTSTLEFSSATWKVLLRVLLGITDCALRIPVQPYNYFAEELDECLLSTLLELLLRSELFSWKIWKSLRDFYPLWCHRMTSIVQWSIFSLALTQRVTKIIYGQGTSALVYTLHTALITFDLSDEFTIYAWHSLLALLAPPPQLLRRSSSPQIFLRSVLGVEKLVQLFLSIGKIGPDGGLLGVTERACPEPNTVLAIFGEWLFQAASVKNIEYHEGRAQALGVLCRLLSRPQNRTPLHPVHLHRFYAVLIGGLTSDLLSIVFIIVNSEDIFSLGLPSIRILIPAIVTALQRILPAPSSPLHVNLNMDDLRRACYKLICTIFGYCRHLASATADPLAVATEIQQWQGSLPPPTGSITPTTTPPFGSSPSKPPTPSSAIPTIPHRSAQPVWIERLRQLYPSTVKLFPPPPSPSPMSEEERGEAESPRQSMSPSLGTFRVELLELLIISLLHETDPGNIRYLINALTAFFTDEAIDSPETLALLIDLLGSLLCSGKWDPKACLVALESLKQLAEHQEAILRIDPQSASNLVKTLSLFALGLFSSAPSQLLPSWLPALLANFDTILAWLGPLSSTWLATSPDCQNALLSLLTTAAAAAPIPMPPGTRPPPPDLPQERLRASPSKSSLLAGTTKSPSTSSIASARAKAAAEMMESPLALAAKATLMALLQRVCLGRDSPFVPFAVSSTANEALLLGQLVNDLHFSPESLQDALDALPEAERSRLCYYLIGDELLLCLLESKATDQPPPGQAGSPPKLFILVRSICGRFTWQGSIRYWPSGLERPPTHSLPARGTNEAVTFGSSFKFANEGGATTIESNACDIVVDSGPLIEQRLRQWKASRQESSRTLVNFGVISQLQHAQHQQSTESLATQEAGHYAGGQSPLMLRASLQGPQPPLGHMHRLFLAHTLLGGIQRFPPPQKIREITTSPALLSAIRDLDRIPERETLAISVLYILSPRQSLCEILNQQHVSQDFSHFLSSLGWPMETARHLGYSGGLASEAVTKTFPYYADDQVEVVFHSPALLDPSGLCEMVVAAGLPPPPTDDGKHIPAMMMHPTEDQPIPPHALGLYKLIVDNLVAILWVEDLDEMLSLPSKLQTNALVFICIMPLRDAQSIGLYRIRIMVTNAHPPPRTPTTPLPASPYASGSGDPSLSAAGEAPYLLGPLLDGMIVRRQVLGVLVRRTAISAALFCLYVLQQKNKP